jgi:hypothetical protein
MDMFRELIDQLFKITETRQVDEMSRDDAIEQLDPYIRHLLWYLANPDRPEKQRTALSSMGGFLKNVEREINSITGRAERKVQDIEVKLLKTTEAAEKRFNDKYVYNRDYNDRIKLDSFLQRIESLPVTLETFGIQVTYLAKNIVRLTVNPSLIGK